MSRAWVRHAECGTSWNANLPWVENQQKVSREQIEAMANVCHSCWVRDQCHDYAVGIGVTYGFWAGRFHHPVRYGRHYQRKKAA